MRISKIVTHSGTFHADELSAIALLQILFGPKIPVERTFTPTNEDFNDPTVFVLDIGRRYEPELNNFDHHQDASLPATNMLILAHFLVPNHLKLANLLSKYMFQYVSDVDTGKVVEDANSIPLTISGIIRGLNNLPIMPELQFRAALEIMTTIVSAQIETANKQIQSEEIWATQVVKDGKVAIHNSTEFLVGWRELAEPAEIRYLVTPNLRAGFQITSWDSNQFPIPVDTRQTFRHNSGFLAAYATLEDAVDHAKSL